MFKYNGKIWNPKNPEKKLKQLGITWDDVEIIESLVEEKKEEYIDPHRLYYFVNPKTRYSITSIHQFINVPGYEPTTLEHLESLWSKARQV